jgi:hypothetical protein
MILPLLLLLAAQHPDRSTDRMPPANPLPPGEDAPAAVLAPLTALLAAGDPATVASLTLADGGADGGVTVVTEDGPGTEGGPLLTHLPWAAFRAGGGVRERLVDPAVEVDGDVATVWSPYLDSAAGRTTGCGIVQAALVRAPAGWRVLTLTRSVRHAGCGRYAPAVTP